MKSLQLIAAMALQADTVYKFMEESDELNKTKLDTAIRSARTHVPNLPPFPDYFQTRHCWKALKEFTEPQINEIFFSTQLCLMLADIKNLSTQENIIRNIRDMSIFRSMAGRKLIIRMAEECTKVDVNRAHQDCAFASWGWNRYLLYTKDLRAIAELARNSFRFRYYYVTVAEADVERIMPTLLNGNPHLSLKRKRAPGGSWE